MQIRQLWLWLLGGVLLAGFATPVRALSDSVDEPGIDARRLHTPPYDLTGRKIGIGQVEVGRPGLFGLDKPFSSILRALDVTAVFLRDEPAKGSTHLDTHAVMVATVMVSRDKRLRGVAPDARLYASAIGSLRDAGQPEECLASQHVAAQNGNDVRAINFSFGEPLRRDPRPNATLDGNALLTRCIDWSARVHNTLYVVAGNQGRGGIPIPTDNYNGLNVAASVRREGRFTKLDFSNLSELPEGVGRTTILREINEGGRRSIDLVAPGSGIEVYNLNGEIMPVWGTSFAAPHVTATIALLQEFGDRVLAQGRPNWSLDARRSEVMRAVLLNAADKLLDSGDGTYLGMARTLLSKGNETWLDGTAARDPAVPLDIEIGAGHLNAYRAYQQFEAGQWRAEAAVPSRGWDYGEVAVTSSRDYTFDAPLRGGSFVAATLTWHRHVELNDANGNDRYDIGENFSDRGVNNLDLYLLPADGDDTAASVCQSVSTVDSVEHIFCPVPSSGRYKLRVQYRQQVNEASQPYGLAWWTQAAN
ncbi:MAG: S8 family serine peptidase [Spirulinaceae cyanobacterium SM2_1_0]|nr:S8 family serine peptidase [Spirulinaceae cyanobacterium SM2_1_0]